MRLGLRIFFGFFLIAGIAVMRRLWANAATA